MTPSTLLFHVEVFMPNNIRRPIFEGQLKYGPHARTEALRDRYGNIELPKLFEASEARIIEAEFDVDTKTVVKQVWRQRLDDDRDLVLVIRPDGFVKTVWVNLRSDKHRTLDKTRYFKR